MRPVLAALALHHLASWLRSRAYLVLVAIAGCIVAAVPLLDEIAGGQETRLLVDFSAFASSVLIAFGLAMLLIVSIGRETTDGYLLAICSRPVSRSTIFFSRFLAAAAAVLVSNVALGALLAAVVAAQGGADTARILVAIFTQSLEAMLVVSFALASVSASGPAESVVMTLLFYVVVRLAPLAPEDNMLVRVLPRLDLIRLGPWARGEPWPAHFATGLAHTVAWTALLVAIGNWRFGRRDLR